MIPRQDLSPAELRGFLMACQCISAFGRVMSSRAGISLAGPQRMIPESQLMRVAGQRISDTGEMLALAMAGRPRTDIPHLAPKSKS